MLDKSINWKQESDTERLALLAIEAAVTSNWEEAVKINKKIVKLAQTNVEALNRLGRAYICAGEMKKAEKIYKKVLDIDPYNIIAKKNTEKLSKIVNTNVNSNGLASGNGHQRGNITSAHSYTNFYLYEPGKTKIIQLLNLAPPPTIACLSCGEKLAMNLKKHGVTVTAEDGTYLGALPDDLAHKLLSYINGGNKYEVYVKFATSKNLTIFIKEIARSARFENQPSFQS